jgi:benzylsuccinate CoA-transferase BbsE subunit
MLLEPYRVLDCTGQLGWLAGRLLADIGADVIKIEPPGASLNAPDWRGNNANKRLLSLDLESDSGRATFLKLAASADILLETAHPASEQACFFDPDKLRAVNPRLIHVSITPFGRTGPRAQWQASDIELMAAGGAMSLAGEPDGIPLRITAPQSNPWAASQAAVGAMVALTGRALSGRGQHVDVSAQGLNRCQSSASRRLHDWTLGPWGGLSCILAMQRWSSKFHHLRRSRRTQDQRGNR